MVSIWFPLNCRLREGLKYLRGDSQGRVEDSLLVPWLRCAAGFDYDEILQ